MTCRRMWGGQSEADWDALPADEKNMRLAELWAIREPRTNEQRKRAEITEAIRAAERTPGGKWNGPRRQ